MTEYVLSKHNFQDPIEIGNEIVLPGENAIARINVGRLPSNTKIDIVAHIYRSINPGPCVLVLGGVHGDEINGIEIVRQCISDGHFEDIQCGSVIAIPLLNIFGFINFSREVPDGKDVNRSFPGSSRGSLASRVASTLTKKILPFVDVALDFHTGGASRYNYPQIRYTKTDKKAQKLAMAFGAKFVIEKGLIAKSFRKSAKDLGIPTLVYEGGESVRLCGKCITTGIQGVKNVLSYLSMVTEKDTIPVKNTIVCKKTVWARASYSGIFVWSKSSGQVIQKGESIGALLDPFGNKQINVISSYSGFIIGHNNASVVNQGDALFHIAVDYETV